MARKGQIAVISSHVPSNWRTCRTIAKNLQKAYQDSLKDDFQLFLYDRYLDELSLVRLSKELYQCKPSVIIFIDHSPHPEYLLKILSFYYGNKPLPPLIFHPYGDLTYYTSDWVRIEPILKKTNVKFICPSHRQVKLVSSLIKNPVSKVELCHFPVDTAVFYFDPAARKSFRKRFSIDDDALLITYVGRVSLQKNVFQLIRELRPLIISSSRKICIGFAGFFDDLAAPIFDIYYPSGAYFQLCNELFERKDLRNKIRYFGNLDQAQLRELYSASDIFASLSLYHDEDFGMAPAESLCCGTSAILTNWGGYPSLIDELPFCKVVGVTLEKSGLFYSSGDLREAFRSLESKQVQSHARIERSHFSQKKLSIHKATSILTKVLSETFRPFEGFTPLMNEFARITSKTGGYPRFLGGPRKNTFYEKIYRHYIGN